VFEAALDVLDEDDEVEAKSKEDFEPSGPVNSVGDGGGVGDLSLSIISAISSCSLNK
jgi:hypothetical protein